MSLWKKLFGDGFKSAGIVQCETCSRQMEVLGFSGSGAVMLSRDEFTSGIGVAEQCWECVKKGMDVNVRNEHGVTALAIAITRGQAETVALLLRCGADPNLVYFDTFASLQQAIEQYLLAQDQQIPTMVSTYKQIIDSLVSHGADIEQAKRLSARAGTANVSEYLRQL